MKQWIWTNKHEEIFNYIKSIKKQLNKSIDKSNYIGKSIEEMLAILESYKKELDRQDDRYILYIQLFDSDLQRGIQGYITANTELGFCNNKKDAYRFNNKEEALDQLNLIKSTIIYEVLNYKIIKI